ncbi:MAG: putative rane protein [Phycisphaerales bacterium]|nr:putative rane protein [Phycisphaerales bacterium]
MLDPSPPAGPPPASWAHNARVGLILFFLYFALYGGFIGIAALAPTAMAKPVLAGANLAVVYGLGLIAAAFMLALVYMVLCRQEPPAEIRTATEAEVEAALGTEGTP